MYVCVQRVLHNDRGRPSRHAKVQKAEMKSLHNESSTGYRYVN